MSNSKPNDDTDQINWSCPICEAVYGDPLAAVRHVLNSQTGNHGDEGSLPSVDNWPNSTKMEPNTKTAGDEMKQRVAQEFDKGDSVYAELESQDIDGSSIPSILSEHDMESLKVLDLADELLEDLEMAQEQLMYADNVMNEEFFDFLNNARKKSQQPVQETTEEDTESEDTEDTTQPKGRVTEGEAFDRETDEVLGVIERGGLLDSVGNDEAYPAFSYIYENRDKTQITVEEVEEAIGAPAEGILNEFDQMGLVEYNMGGDHYHFVY